MAESKVKAPTSKKAAPVKVPASKPAKKAPLVDAEALKAKAEAEAAEKAAEAAHARLVAKAAQAFFEGHPGDVYAGITREEAGVPKSRRVGS